MILTILSLWMHQAIGNTTAKRIKEILSGLKSKELTSIKIGTLQKHGIVLMKAVDGIVSTEKKLQEIESLSKLYVSIAVKPMTLIVTRVSIVRGLVSRLLGVRVALMMLYSNVSSVIRILPKINTQRKRHALQYANANIKAIGNCQKVYSISIEGLGCYYANGILVSNSNALDYIQFTFLQYPKEPRPQLEVNRDLEWDKLFKKKNILKNEKDWRVSV